MSKQIKRQDIVENDVFALITTSAETAIKKVNSLNEELTNVGTSFKDSLGKLKTDNTDDIAKLIKQVKELSEYTKQQTEAISQQEKITRELEKTRALKKKGEDDELARLQKLQTAKQQAYEKEFALLVKSEAEIKRLEVVKKNASDSELLRLEKLRLAEEQTKNQIQKNLNDITQAKLVAQEKTDKIRIAQQKELDRQSDRSTREANQQAKAQEKANAEAEKARKIAEDQSNAYKRLEKNTRDLKNISKQLGAEMLELERDGKKNTAEYIKLARQYDEVTKSALQGDKALKKLDQQVGDNFRKVGNYENALKGLKGALTQLGLAFGVFDAVRFIFDTQVKLDSLNLALKNVSKTTAEYTSNYNFLVQTSKNYGQDLLVLIDTYKNFIASSESSNISLSGRKRIYESIIKSGSALALSNEDIEGSLRAVSQMFSKGTVSSEELRQQLGERLPGAFGIMAKSMGVSEEALNDMLKKGEVMADDVMPRFARELEKAFGKNATERLKTIGGAFNNLKTSIALYFDQLQKGVGINRTFAWILNTIASNIGTLISLTGNLIKYFIEYKIVVIALEAVEMARNKTLLLSIARTLGFATATETADGAVTKLTLTTETLGKALRALSYVAILEIILYLKDALTGVISLQDKVDRLNKQTNIGITNTKNFIDDVYEKMNKKLEKYNYLLKQGEKGKEAYRQKEKEFNAESITYLKDYNEQIIARRNQLIADRDKLKPDLMNKSATIGGIGTQIVAQKYGIKPDALDLGTLRTDKVYNQLNASIKATYEQQKLLNAEIKDQEKILNKVEPAKIDKSKDVLDHTKAVKTVNIEYNKTNEYLSKQLELLQQLRILKADYSNVIAESNADIAIQNEIDSAKQYGVVLEANYRTAINGERQLKLENAKSIFEAQKLINPDKLQEKYNTQLDDLLLEKKKNNEKLLKLKKQFQIDEAELENNKKKKNLSTKAKSDIVEEQKRQVLQAEEIAKLDLQVQQGYNDKVLEIEQQRANQLEDINTQKLIDKEAYEQKVDKINKDANKKLRDAGKATTDELAEYNLNKIKSISETANQFVQDSLGYFIRVAETRMQQLDNYMGKLTQQMTFLEEKVASGSITAQESLAVVEKEQQEVEKRKIKEQRKQQRLQMAQTIFNAYNANVQSAKVGDNPLRKTLSDVAVLSAFIGALPTYFEGTDTTIADSLGKPQLQGRDGYIVRVDGSEKVLNPQLSKMTGDMTTYEIAKLAEDKLRGNIISRGEGGVSIMNNTWQTELIVSELQDLKNTIRNKPETNIEVGEILGGVMKIVETKKQGNFTNRNITRLS